jgi:hypothetical protein
MRHCSPVFGFVQRIAVFLARIVMPRSLFEIVAVHHPFVGTTARSLRVPDCFSSWSTRVVLP